MKSVITRTFTWFVIPIGLIFWSTGIFQTFYEYSKQSPTEPFSEFTEDDFKTLEITPQNEKVYMDTLMESRRKLFKEKKYSAYQYLHDNKQIEMYEEKYPETKPTPNRFNAGFYLLGCQKSELYSMHYNLLRTDGGFSDDSVEKARALVYPNHENYLKELAKSRSQEPPITWNSSFKWLIGWLTRFYLRGIIFAFILFLIWKFQMKSKTISPFSFLISLTIWPIVLGVDIYNRTRDFIQRAEVVARRSVMLGLFSKQEERLLELGKKMSLREFREYLDSIGMTRKHSLAAALLAVVFMSFMPHFADSSHAKNSNTHLIITSFDQGGLYNVSQAIDFDDGSTGLMAVMLDVPDPYLITSVFYYFQEKQQILQGFLADIGGVPKVTISFARN